MAHNPNCDGGHCREASGEVRVYSLGAGGNLILCHACWAHENKYREERGRETRNPADWPQLNWYAAEIYGAEFKRYSVEISARKEGAIGQFGTEHRTYEIATNNPDAINALAIDRAYQEGGIEHVRVISVKEATQ